MLLVTRWNASFAQSFLHWEIYCLKCWPARFISKDVSPKFQQRLLQRMMKLGRRKKENKIFCLNMQWIAGRPPGTLGAEIGSVALPSIGTTSPLFVPRTKDGAQPSISSVHWEMEKEEADRVVGMCFLWSDIPFSIAKNNLFYHSMFEVATIVGVRYKGDFL